MALVAFLPAANRTLAASDATPELWTLAQKSADTHRFSTLFTAQCVESYLSSEADIAESIRWCKESGITKVYLEEYRDGYQAERQTLVQARDSFKAAGFLVSGCVTTTRLGKPSDHWSSHISCYTDAGTQEHLQAVFEYAAGLFDEIMIDDFWFTDCTCTNCDAARRARLVTIGSKTYPVNGDTWADYRCELMLRLSQDRVLAAARRVNPKVKIIIKYPQWYDGFQERGYDVTRETAAFDRIWVGTEVRDFGDSHWGGVAPYEGYFLMRWLGGIGGEKCGGGWYDWLGTSEPTYVEQARQTVLGGARESMLFCFGGLPFATRVRRISPPSAPTCPNCWPSRAKSNAASRLAWPPTNRPTAIRRRNAAYLILSACWACRWRRAMNFRPMPRRQSCPPPPWPTPTWRTNWANSSKRRSRYY